MASNQVDTLDEIDFSCLQNGIAKVKSLCTGCVWLPIEQSDVCLSQIAKWI